MKTSNALIAAVVSTVVAGCVEQEADYAPPAARPVLTTVVEKTVDGTRGFAGTIESRHETKLGFQVLGRVISREAGLGEAVTKGKRLAALDPIALELAVRSARASVATAEAKFTSAAASEDRHRRLHARGVSSQAQFELVQRNRETAAAALDEARANLAKAKEQLGYTELHAEFDGVVTAVHSEVGQIVSPGQAVMTIARTDAREAVVDVPDRLLGDLAEGAAFDVALQIDPSVRVPGRLREAAPDSDPITRTRRLRIVLDAVPDNFRLGTLVTAAPTAATATRVAIPASALVERDGTASIWVVDPQTGEVSPRSVTVGSRAQSRVEVLDGVAPGSRIVVAGVHSLSSGQRVKIFEETRP